MTAQQTATVIACAVILLAFVIVPCVALVRTIPVDRPAQTCTEDSWCWQPLVMGNGRGSIDLADLTPEN
jgi:hypothetical protein